MRILGILLVVLGVVCGCGGSPKPVLPVDSPLRPWEPDEDLEEQEAEKDAEPAEPEKPAEAEPQSLLEAPRAPT